MFRSLTAAAAAALGLAGPAEAHPHVFVDGGVDFVMAGPTTLEALTVTWLFDEFETLYDLSSRGIEPKPDGTLSEADRETLRLAYSDWPDDFDGSAHLTIDGAPVAMDWPSDLSVDLVDGRLQFIFRRALPRPEELSGRQVEVAFYESTYFFAFKVTNTPRFEGPADCAAEVVPNMPGEQSEELQAQLALLGREETPQVENIGALFADRIVVTCG